MIWKQTNLWQKWQKKNPSPFRLVSHEFNTYLTVPLMFNRHKRTRVIRSSSTVKCSPLKKKKKEGGSRANKNHYKSVFKCPAQAQDTICNVQTLRIRPCISTPKYKLPPPLLNLCHWVICGLNTCIWRPSYSGCVRQQHFKDGATQLNTWFSLALSCQPAILSPKKKRRCWFFYYFQMLSGNGSDKNTWSLKTSANLYICIKMNYPKCIWLGEQRCHVTLSEFCVGCPDKLGEGVSFI